MRERPIQDLLDAIAQLGVTATSDNGSGCPPITIQAAGARAGSVTVRADVSSQFLSGLLMASPFIGGPVTIRIDGPLVSEPYVEMTMAMLQHWGIEIRQEGTTYRVSEWAGQGPPNQYVIEPDASAASYFFGAAAILGGKVVLGWHAPGCLQGDMKFPEVLATMGCKSMWCVDGYVVQGPESSRLRGIDVDMNAISDTVMTLGAVACFADGPTTIRNVAHIRHKETDRIAALATELRRLGAEVEEIADGLTITPNCAWGGGRNVQRPPDGNEPGVNRVEGAGREDQEPRLRREDVPGVLAGPGKVAVDRDLLLGRFGPERAEGVDLGEDLGPVFALGLGQLPLQLPHLFLAVIPPVQLGATLHHDGQSPA